MLTSSGLTAAFLALVGFAGLSFGQAPLSPGDHTAPVNGIELHYFVRGEGPVCLLPTPGWGPSLNSYKNSLTPFEQYFTMVYYDTRLSGQSTGPADSTKYTSQDFMNDMEGLRVHLKQPKIWVMGHSMGGFQVLNYGIHHGDKLLGVIALSAFAGQDSLYGAELTKAMMRRKGEPYFEKGSDIFFRRDTTAYTLAESMSYVFPFYFHDPTKMADFARLGDPELSNEAWEKTNISKFGTEYLFPELHRIKVPTLVVVGDDDFICDKISQADRITKEIKRATEIVVADAGHFSWVEQPEPFFSACFRWLEAQGIKKR